MSAVRRPIGVAVLAVLLGALGFVVSTATPSSAVPNGNGFVLASNGSLVPLQVSPGSVVTMPALPVTGVVAGQSLVGIDFRPATGGLVGVGVDLTTGTASVYTIATGSNPAVATPVAAPFALDSPAAPIASGTTFGVDFNPIVDLIRLVGSNGTNYRLNPTTGVLAGKDTALAYVPAEANAPAVASAGYTNNFGAGQTTATGAKGTTLYALDGAKDALVAIDNPNGGQVRTIGALGLDIATDAELDITANGLAYALVNTANGDQLRTVNLTTGAAGPELATISLGGGVTSVGVAIETGTTSPVPAGEDGYIVTSDGTLASFELNVPPTAPSPGTLTTVGPITGLASGFAVEGIDTRPADGVLWGIAVNGTQAQLFTLNTTTAVATPFAAAFTIAPASDYGFDFNPTVDRIRFVTAAGANFRLNPTVVGNVTPVAFVDGSVSGTPTPTLTSTAYTNSFAGVATGATIHLGIDDANDSLIAFTNSNAGTTKTVAPLNVTTAGDTGLDVATDGRVFFVNGATVNTLNPITGAATSLGTLTTGTPRAFAIGRNQVPRAAVTITADNQTRPFGTANPVFTATITGVAPGDSLDTAPTCTTTATSSSPVGSYPITCSGAADPAYTFTYVDGTLTVTPAGTTLALKAPISLQGRIAISIGSATATLRTADGAPVANAPITFSAGGRPLCTATTNASGVARCTFNVLGVVRVFASNGYQASYAGNGNLAGTTGSTPLIR